MHIENAELIDTHMATRLWNRCCASTQMLASELCECLRIALEPTSANKLQYVI